MTADGKLKSLRARQLDARLARWRQLVDTRPAEGWVKAIRESLGMTTTQLARRMGVAQARVMEIQRREVAGTLTLPTLKRAAEALDCELVYALVPRGSLRGIRERQAVRAAEHEIAEVGHSMALENQSVGPAEARAQVEELAEEAVRTWSRRIWDV